MHLGLGGPIHSLKENLCGHNVWTSDALPDFCVCFIRESHHPVHRHLHKYILKNLSTKLNIANCLFLAAQFSEPLYDQLAVFFYVIKLMHGAFLAEPNPRRSKQLENFLHIFLPECTSGTPLIHTAKIVRTRNTSVRHCHQPSTYPRKIAIKTPLMG